MLILTPTFSVQSCLLQGAESRHLLETVSQRRKIELLYFLSIRSSGVGLLHGSSDTELCSTEGTCAGPRLERPMLPFLAGASSSPEPWFFCCVSLGMEQKSMTQESFCAIQEPLLKILLCEETVCSSGVLFLGNYSVWKESIPEEGQIGKEMQLQQSRCTVHTGQRSHAKNGRR